MGQDRDGVAPATINGTQIIYQYLSTFGLDLSNRIAPQIMTGYLFLVGTLILVNILIFSLKILGLWDGLKEIVGEWLGKLDPDFGKLERKILGHGDKDSKDGDSGPLLPL
ncbi:MAG: hypothetical protein Q9168_006102 [Polycauliona sp. 1 TL-2023]